MTNARQETDDVIGLKPAQKRVLFISTRDLSLPEGPSVNEREFVLALSQTLGERLHCLISRTATPLEELVGIETTTFAPEKNRNPACLLHHHLDLYRKARRILNSGCYVLIVCRLGLFPVGLWLLSKRYSGLMVIRHLRGFPRDINLLRRGAKYWFGRLTGPLNSLIHGELARNALAVDACTPEHMAGIISNHGIEPEKVLHVENATNTNRFRPGDRWEAREKLGLSRFDPIVGYAGGKPSERGGKTMLRLAPQLIKKYPGIGFVIVGNGRGLGPLIDQVKRAGLSEYFFFAGLVDYAVVPDYVRAFDVGLNLPSMEKIRKTGSSAQKIRQYIAAGIPVVASAAGNLFVEEHALGSLVDPQDPAAIRSALERWLDRSPAERKAHASRAAAFARERLSVERTVQQRMEFWSARLEEALRSGCRAASAPGCANPLSGEKCSSPDGVSSSCRGNLDQTGVMGIES